MSLLDSLPDKPEKSGSLLDSLPDQSREEYPNIDKVPVSRRIFSDPARDNRQEVLGVHRQGSPVFKTPQQTQQAITDIADVPATVGSLIATPVIQAGAGLAALGSVVKDDLSYGKPLDRAGSLAKAARMIQDSTRAASYQPQTPAGQAVQRVVSYPFQKLAEAGQYVGEKTEDITGSPTAGALADTAVNLTPFLLPFLKIGGEAGLKAVRESETYRKMTIPERGLVVQTYDDMVKSGMSEAQLARKNPDYFREAVKRRSKTEADVPSVLDSTFPKEDVNVQSAEERGVGHNIEETPQEVTNGTDIISQPGESGAEINQQEGTGNLDTQPREGSGAEPAPAEGESAPKIAQEVQDGETAREAAQDGAQAAPAQEDGREAGLAQETAVGDADRLAAETATQGDITAQEVLDAGRSQDIKEERNTERPEVQQGARDSDSGGMETGAGKSPDTRVQPDSELDVRGDNPSISEASKADMGKGASLPTDPARAVLPSLTEPQPVKALRDLHGKETVAKLIADSMITPLGGGKVGLTKRGAKWLEENPYEKAQIPEPETAPVAPAEESAGGEPDGIGPREDAAIPSLRDTGSGDRGVEEESTIPAKEKVAAKQRWEMTLGEALGKRDEDVDWVQNRDPNSPKGMAHRKAVEEAVAKGEPVPQNVLKSYPWAEAERNIKPYVESLHGMPDEQLKAEAKRAESELNNVKLSGSRVAYFEISGRFTAVSREIELRKSAKKESPTEPVTLETAKIEGKKIPKETKFAPLSLGADGPEWGPTDGKTTEVDGSERDRIAKNYADLLGQDLTGFHRDFADAVIAKDARRLQYLANGLNEKGKKAFTEATGVSLPKQQGKTWEVLMTWGGLDAEKENLVDAFTKAKRTHTRVRKDAEEVKTGDSTLADKIDELFDRGYTVYGEVPKEKGRGTLVSLSKSDNPRDGLTLGGKGFSPSLIKDYAKAKIELAKAQSDLDGYKPKDAPKKAAKEAKPADTPTPLNTEDTSTPARKIEEEDKPFTLSAHKEFAKRLREGEITDPAEVQAVFASLRDNAASIKAELSMEKKDDLLKRMGGFKASRYKSEKKDAIIKAVYDDMVTDFAYYDGSDSLSWSHGQKIEDVVQKRVDAITPEGIKAYQERHAARVSESKKWVESQIKALKNPETWEEFKGFIRMNKGGIDALTPEQRKRYDELHAEHNKDVKAQQQERKAEVRSAGATVDAEIVQTKHTKTGDDLYVVKAAERVEKDIYNRWNTTAKRLGGWYSSYRKDGAVPGFQFKTMENAEAFQKYLQGETEAATEAVKERIGDRQETKKNAAADRLTALAESMEEKANGVLNADRLTNTAKRAGQAEATEGAARKQIALAKTIRNIAEAIQEGEAKHLEGISAGTHVETMDGILEAAKYANLRKNGPESWSVKDIRFRKPDETDMDHVEYPYPRPHRDHLRELGATLQQTPGAVRDGDWLKKLSFQAGDESVVELRNPADIERLEGALAKAKRVHRLKSAVENTADRMVRYKRLQKMGIQDLPSLRAALREYLEFKDEGPKADRAKQLERSLVGGKHGIDFFPTPPNVAADMVDRAGIKPGMKVLEPSAGNGNIAEAMKEAGAEVDAAEISTPLREVLEAKGHNLVARDFMDYEPGPVYDRIVMNPPFSADIEHVQHAFDLLKLGGRLIAIVGEGSFGNQKKHAEFQAWLEDNGASVEKLPASTFTDRTQLRTTGANARLVEIEKAKAEDGTTLHDITSIPSLALEALGKIATAGKEALPHLEALGKSVYEQGGTTFAEFKDALREKLGDLWDRFKEMAGEVWEKVKAKLKDERGLFAPFGGDINETKGQFSDLTDKKAKVEIDDSGAKLIRLPKYKETGKLPDFLEHDELYAKIPEMRDVNVVKAFGNGSYNAETNTISLPEHIGRNANYHGLKTALHEAQHAIQERNGFAKGGSSEAINGIGAKAFLDLLSKTRTQAKERYAAYEKEYQAFKATGEIDTDVDKYYRESLSSSLKLIQDMDTKQRDFIDGKVSNDDALLIYHRLAGEEESRRVSARADIPASERIGNPYGRTDIADPKDLIVDMHGSGKANAVGVDIYHYDRHKALFDRYVDILADGDERALAEFEASPEWQALNGMPGDVEDVIQQAGAETARQALTDMDQGNVESAQTRVNALSHGEERLTSLKNEQTAKESGPQDKWEYTREGIIDEGKNLVDSGAFDPRQAARDIVQNPRMILTHEQQAGLLYDRQRIYNEYEGMADALAKAMAEQDNQSVVTLRQQRAALEDALEANAQAATYLGTGWSAFGQVRQAFMDKDYSPLWLQTRAKAALGKGELPEHIKSEMAEMSAQVKKLEAEYQKALKHAEELEAQKAVERIKGEVKTKKTIQKEKSAEGKEARQKEFHSLAEKLKKVLDPNKLSINLAIVDPEAGRIIGEMARLKIIDGITGAKEIVDDIHSELSGQVSKRDIQDTLSGYGKTAELSQDEINVTLREVRRQLRLFSALEDAESGTVPLHSGMQRDPVSDEVRELTQKVKEVMRETGLDQSDQTPEQQWRTAMDTVHTRLKNQIRDLDKQIDQHKKTRKPLRKLDYDEEAKALVKLRDERRGTLEEIDRINKLMEKEPVADETPEMAKLAKFMADTERAIKAEEKRLEMSAEEYRKKTAGEVAPAKDKTHVPDTPRLEELRRQRDEAKAQYQALKQKAKRDPEEARANAALKAIEKAIERNEAALRGEKPEKQGQGAPVSKELALRRIYNDSLRQALKEMKEAQKTPKDPEAAKLKAYKTRLLKRESDLNEMLTTENFDKSARKVLKLDSEAEKLASRVAQKKELVEARMRQLQRASLGGLDKKIYLFGKGLRFSILSGTKVLWKISVASMVTRPLQTTLEEAAGALNLLAMGPKYRAIAAGAPRQGGGFNARAEAAAYVQWFKSEQYRNMWDELRQGKMSIEIKYGNKDGTEDRRGIQTWGETKMDHADYIFDFPGRLHGTLKAVAYTQEFHRALQIITEHFIRNGRDMSDPINQLLVKNLAETEANRARLMSDHVVQGAYKAFLRTIEAKGSAGGKIAAALVRANFPITKVPLNYFSEATSFLPPVGWTKARLLRLSAELRVKETPEGKELLGEALFQAALEEMTDAEKDAYVRALKKQTVGVVVGATIGYFLYKHFGGYYKRGERRKRGELKPGEIQIMGVNLADTWFHAPFFESLQSWAMLHHMQDLADKKDEKAAKAAKRHNEPAPEKTGEFEKAATGALAAGVGMVDRVPYVGTPIRVYNQLQSYQGTLDYASALLLRAVLPQLGAEAAKSSDTIDDVVVPRKTQTIGQKIMVAIPGLREKLPIDPKKLKRMDIGDLAVIASHADTLKADKKELAKIFGAKLKHDYSELKDKDPESLKVYRDIYSTLKR